MQIWSKMALSIGTLFPGMNTVEYCHLDTVDYCWIVFIFKYLLKSVNIPFKKGPKCHFNHVNTSQIFPAQGPLLSLLHQALQLGQKKPAQICRGIDKFQKGPLWESWYMVVNVDIVCTWGVTCNTPSLIQTWSCHILPSPACCVGTAALRALNVGAGGVKPPKFPMNSSSESCSSESWVWRRNLFSRRSFQCMGSIGTAHITQRVL